MSLPITIDRAAWLARLRRVMSKGFIHLNRQCEPAVAGGRAPAERTEFRVTMLQNTTLDSDELDPAYRTFLPAAQWLAGACLARRWLSTSAAEPAMAERAAAWENYVAAIESLYRDPRFGTAELLAREAEIKKVLVVCPASLKSQWRGEIHRFCDREVQLIGGAVAQRMSQYNNECFFTVCNYEQVLRDIVAIEQVKWDLIILDEGQRIKNWEAKTSSVIKSLKSRFALVLSGTPLENRLDDLYSVVQFVDDANVKPSRGPDPAKTNSPAVPRPPAHS